MTKLTVNIDGIPLFKSSKTQFWPILGLFGKLRVFIIAPFCGSMKPNSVTDYLEEFLTEIMKLKEEGIICDDKAYSFSVKAFVCDAPARAFLKCTICHTGYYSCERCQIKGTWQNRVVFNEDDLFAPRTTDEFNEYAYEYHQKALSPLVYLVYTNFHWIICTLFVLVSQREC